MIARVVSMRRRSNARWRGSLAAVALVAASLSASARAQERQLPWPPASLEVCDALVVAEPDNVRSYYCYSAVVRAGRGSRDTAFARVAALLARRPPSPHALYVRALLLADRYDPGAEDAYAAAIAAYDASGDPRGQVRARVYLSTFRSMTGQERIAEPLTDAERIAKATGDAQLVALVTVEQAWAAYRSTDYGRATRLLESIEAVVRGPAASDLQSKWLSCRGAVHWALGDIDRARAIYLEELALHRRTANAYDEAVTLGNLALLASGTERAGYARQSLALARRHGNSAGEVSSLSMLAAAAPTADALAFLGQAEAVARRTEDREGLSSVLRSKGSRLAAIDQAAAMAALDEAIDVSRSIADRNELVRNLIVRATTRWEVGPRHLARAESLQVLDAVEAMRNLQPEDRVRAVRFGQWRAAYYRAAGHLLAGHLLPEGQAPSPQDRDEAFRISERLRARHLLDRLDASRAVVPVHADQALVRRRTAVLERITSLNRELASPGLDPARRARLLASVDAAERDEAEAAAALATASPAFAMIRRPTLATLADVQATLAPDEALIAFQIHAISNNAGKPYGAWRWVVTRTAIDVRPLDRVGQLGGAVQMFMGLATADDVRTAAVASQVYERVFGEALEALPSSVRRLVIVPDDSLYQVPFDALRAAPDAPLLAERFAIALAPSATTWWRLRQLGASAATKSALIYADPQGRSAWSAFVPGASAAVRSDSTLVPLPEARREGARARRSLAGTSRMLAGTDATESALKAETLGDYRILHVAAHAVLDAARPERTAVLLAPSDADDGMLQVREIVDLPLGGQLVVLSACQSANGVLVPAEGLFGLSHAFVLAGARVVVANLWPVRDGDAADFMALMYAGIGDGLSVREAVHVARRESIARGRPASAWAGMVVLGDGDLVPMPPRTGVVRWYHAVAVALGAVAVGTWWSRRRTPRA